MIGDSLDEEDYEKSGVSEIPLYDAVKGNCEL